MLIMELKTKKRISYLIITVAVLSICIASGYAYLHPEETYFASDFSIFAVLIASSYYFGKGKNEARQKHLGLSLLIMAFVPAVLMIVTTYRWYVGLPSFTSVTTPEAAFVVVWAKAIVWFIAGIMVVIGSYHTDEIVEMI